MIPNLYKTININSVSEIIIEKSKFISNIIRIQNEDDAVAFIAQMKKKHWDATHNCSAFILATGSMRSSDDGEPSGTAGKPMLECLKKNELYDVAVVVTRYFGGIKLGAGGLIRAYTSAVQSGIKRSGIVERVFHKSLALNISYPFWNKIECFMKSKNIIYEKPKFCEDISVKLFVLNEIEFIDDVTNICNGNIKYELGEGEFIEVLLHKPI